MTRIAVTGHRGIAAALAGTLAASIRASVAPYATSGLTGVSCLADGADQLFARVVLDLGGRLEAVVLDSRVPQRRSAADQAQFDALLARCAAVRWLACDRATGGTHMQASRVMLHGADLLIAVWDGLPARKYGGTGDVVDHARAAGIPVAVLWPPGVTRQWPVRQQRARHLPSPSPPAPPSPSPGVPASGAPDGSAAPDG